MKRFMLAALALACVGASGFAADNAKPMTKQGDKALLFSLGGLSNLAAGDFQGGLGFKYYIVKGISLRAGLGFSSASQTFKNPSPGPLPPTAIGESKYTLTVFSVAPGVLFDIATSNSVVAYVGGQVIFAMTSTEQDGTLGPLPDTTPNFVAGQKLKTTSTSFGAGALAGVEWFAWDNISFGAEYVFGFVTNSGKTEASNAGVTTSVDSPTSTLISLTSISGGNLTLAVYF